jgi:threonine dehydratase
MDDFLEDTGPIDLVDTDAVARAVVPEVRPTTFVRAEALDAAAGAEVILAVEAFQPTGSFKDRGAAALALHLPAEHLLCASSGNFGAALARACRRHGKRATVVMPAASSKVKIAAVERQGGSVELVDTQKMSRKARLLRLAEAHPEAAVVSPYDDTYVIAGNSTLGDEIFAAHAPDAVLVPVGGGGLASGLVHARARAGKKTPIIGAEPLLANDAARSLRAGVLVRDEKEADTLCDGARTLSLGQRNFAILRRGLERIVEIAEDGVAAALRLCFSAANLKVEPTAALSVAALLADRAAFAQKRVVCVVSGGNVDPSLYARLLSAA